MNKFLGLIILLLLLVTSCVPTRKITYLQESDAVKNDTLIRIQKVQAPYRLQINDILSIQVKAPYDQNVVSMFNVSGGANAGAQGGQQGGGLYFNGYTVDLHGDIRVPQLGKIKALGLTLEELREYIEKRLLTEYFKDNADLFVTVRLGGLRYVMTGEVGSKGEQVIFRDQATIVEAISNGGGVPITGDLTNVRIVRQYPEGVKVHHLDLTQLDVIYSPYYYIQPNDMIVVDPLPQKALGTGTTGLASFTTIISVFTTLVTTLLFITRL
ncbi:protein involved in gliding motility EpsA [Nonlabens dokdonensis]|jgi:polysaccharide export outer membrane protein|uniref:Protein involved in gliding motility EpsA n=2 Tax=Nonlabens dokdonensis TaxID=328515 RepID=A0ABX5PYH2_9FLAO|nr:polysaccharide biosynthesis/export family protein [Nonlabens dokdonensis]AGC77393.1 putative EPS related membrane protein [Nonlabens dokdonensis DSW-6]PZX40919.1 protein involved in gliding motility EpsA [Nonlabens dokdonensis]